MTMEDPLQNFGRQLDSLVRRWEADTGGRCDVVVRPTFIDEPPADGFRRQRLGPRVEITLTLTDMARVGELLIAHFPVADAARLIMDKDK